MEKLKGVSDKVEILVICNKKKSKIASLSLQPFMVKMGSKSENGIFCYFFSPIFTKGI